MNVSPKTEKLVYHFCLSYLAWMFATLTEDVIVLPYGTLSVPAILIVNILALTFEGKL